MDVRPSTRWPHRQILIVAIMSYRARINTLLCQLSSFVFRILAFQKCGFSFDEAGEKDYKMSSFRWLSGQLVMLMRMDFGNG